VRRSITHACLRTAKRNTKHWLIWPASWVRSYKKLRFHIEPLAIATGPGAVENTAARRKTPGEGDADFTVADYESFKKTYLGQSGFGIIRRPEMEMIELIDPVRKVIAYFSDPTLAAVMKLASGCEQGFLL